MFRWEFNLDRKTILNKVRLPSRISKRRDFRRNKHYARTKIIYNYTTVEFFVVITFEIAFLNITLSAVAWLPTPSCPGSMYETPATDISLRWNIPCAVCDLIETSCVPSILVQDLYCIGKAVSRWMIRNKRTSVSTSGRTAEAVVKRTAFGIHVHRVRSADTTEILRS